jgi:protein-S-isoprenylcysteine O-methyltransferase Ste14
MKAGLIARAVFVTFAVPGVVTIAAPYVILHRSGAVWMPALSLLSSGAATMWAVSLAALLHSIWAFAAYGEGTLVPVDPPKVLVVRGLYRYTRNPMYLGVVGMLLSEAILFRSSPILIYAAVAWLLFHVFVVHYEEPTLRRDFGPMWQKYCEAVPRWGIVRRPYTPPTRAA